MRLQSLKSPVGTLGLRVQQVTDEQARGNSHQRGYTRKWRNARAQWFKHHPLCVECLKDGRAVEATQLDHIEPHKGDMQKFWDRTNWQGLCASHHSAKTAREDGGFGN